MSAPPSTPSTIVGFERGVTNPEALVEHEWLVTNGLGGYASGTISGVITRRFHGLLVAGLRNPLGRTMMLNQITEWLVFPDGHELPLGGRDARAIARFELQLGLPVWVYELEGVHLEKRLFLPARQNTVVITYHLHEGPPGLALHLRPSIHVRPHEGSVATEIPSYTVSLTEDRLELLPGPPFPGDLRLRMLARSSRTAFVFEPTARSPIEYAVEAARGYDSRGALWSRGRFDVALEVGATSSLVASVEDWEVLLALEPHELAGCERDRRRSLLNRVHGRAPDPVEENLVLAADQFVISPVGRAIDAVRARARGDSLRTVIAGYHWFTDWGRDTMISLEGLCLLPGRHREARWILRTFACYVRDGLVPNLFPEGAQEGVYNTADATLWFFHALERYVAYTGDTAFVRELLPLLENIVARHIAGTRFGIRVDERDGLLTQGEDGYALTWMDAKCGDWVVTPRRGKTVEINALWYNALSALAAWVRAQGRTEDAAGLEARAADVRASFNGRFWHPDAGSLWDVVDGPELAYDGAMRPNQLLAISLPHAVLAPERWRSVVDRVTETLLTPVGLRSLAPGSPGYQRSYHGDLRTRDAAYHQGTVWSWLLGPYVDALLRAYPDARPRARQCLRGLTDTMKANCLGQIAEVFDAEAPFHARGCAAQAWGVAELLRALDLTSEARRAPSRDARRP